MYENAFNYTTQENKVEVKFCTSEAKGCSVNNILSSERKSIWLSSKSVPQSIILDLTKMQKRPNAFKYWGLYCWHAYSTNPKKIEILFSSNNSSYTSIGCYDIAMKPGKQFYKLKKEAPKIKINYIKIIIKETHGGGNQTYLNQLFFFDDKADVEDNLMSKVPEKEEQSFFNIDNFKEEEDEEMSYDLVEPMGKMSQSEQSEKENSMQTEKRNIDIEDANNEEEKEKEKKIKKLEKILKSKDNLIIKNSNQSDKNTKLSKYHNDYYSDENYYDDEDNNYTNDEYNNKQKTHNSSLSFTQQHKSARSDNCTMKSFFNNYNPNNKTTKDPKDYNSVSSSLYAHTLTNIYKRPLTPINPNSNQITHTPLLKERNNNLNNNNNNKDDSDYLKLENQLKEMEDQLKSLNVDVTMVSSKNLVHSKSFSCIQSDSAPPLQHKTENNNIDINQYLMESNKETYDYPLQPDIIQTPITPKRNLSYSNSQNNDKIHLIETKLQRLEEELKFIKDSFNKISKSIEFITQKAQNVTQINEIPQKNDKINEIVDIVFNECSKMINAKFSEIQTVSQGNNQMNPLKYQSSPNKNFQIDTNGNKINLSTDSNLNSFENRINKKIEEKLELLSNNIQNQIFKGFLQPYIQSIENTMKSNIDEIKEKLNFLNKSSSNLNQSQGSSFIDLYRESRSYQSSQSEIGKSIQRRNENYEEINKIGEKLYDKLIEKEKKLKDLKNEATNYLQTKLKKDEKKYNAKKINIKKVN